ncbi:MAG: sugar nucleotide-binding protein [Deltaproteobacteria bacterium]|nr:sugar nucleotide-binding protein [Deltaproteobacteria bacterium]
MARILVIGGDSTIGAALVSYLQKKGESVITTTRRASTITNSRIYLNLSDTDDKFRLPGPFDVAIICAGVTKIAACRVDSGGSTKINVDAVSAIARILADDGTRIVYLSTNQVFDGYVPFPTHQTPVSPITEYGKQKAEVEHRLLSSYPDRVVILRLTKVIGPHHDLFDKWYQNLKKGETIFPFSNMFIAPIPLSFVVSTLYQIVKRCSAGVFHLSADRDISYSEAAFLAAQILNADQNLIVPTSAAESKLIEEPFPIHTCLNTDRLTLELGIQPPDATPTVKQFFSSLKALAEGVR